MRIQDALIAWNVATEQDDLDRYPPGVKVVEKITPFPRGWWVGYRSTWGACSSEWCKMDDNEAIVEILAMFHALVLQGLPPFIVDQAFLEIEGYRAIRDGACA